MPTGSMAATPRLIDGGVTTQGQPFLVMEYVEGVPLDRYCSEQELSATARLSVFRKVCDEVHYAHQHLIVHRDLKPGNILVTAEGEPKLLDFGIAKLLDTPPASPEQTATGLLFPTPLYASPEQVKGEKVTTASDVYSLGVILYELLTGRRPYDTGKETPVLLVTAILQQEPQGGLSGDLDYIVRKAMRKSAAERYGSVEQFSDDVRRYLEGQPVLARKGSFRYYTGRFIQRNRMSAAAAALAVLALAGGLVGTLWQARLARREADRAQAANHFLTEIFEIPAKDSSSRRDLTVRELLELAEKRVPPLLGSDPAVAADVDYALGGGLIWQGAMPQARTLLERSLRHARPRGSPQNRP
ncbi:MAG: serine/threonine protein kinase [Acidobacteria bacterium]|nr:serine/threonine protein kinase [Acidobacteriota bacterium]